MKNYVQDLKRDQPYHCKDEDVFNSDGLFEEVIKEITEEQSYPRIFYPDSISPKEFAKIIRFNLRKFERKWAGLDKKSIEDLMVLFLEDSKIKIP